MHRSALVAVASAAAFGLLASSATAQNFYRQDFESLSASAAGVPLTGQDGYAIPAGTTSVDVLTHTYTGNPYGFPANPTGGAQFIGGNGPAGGAYCRAQRPFAWQATAYTIGFDVAVGFLGTLPAGQNCGSVSTQPGTTNASLIALARWTDINTAANWNADFIYFDAAGAQVTGVVPDPAFQNLSVNHWYRYEVDFDHVSNEIVELRLRDLTSGTVAVHAPVGWYLAGGSAGGLPLPTDFRFFIGGGVAGNVMGYDNLSIGPRATADTYGAGCAGSNGTPALDAAAGSAPRVGTSLVLEATSLPTGGSVVFALLGFSDTNFGGLPLPFDLLPFGMPGCFLLTDVAGVLQQIAAGTSTTWPLPIPDDANLLGVDVFMQALVTDNGANSLGVTASNGVRLHLGG